MKVPGVDALRDALGALNLDSRGHKATLKKRLRAAQKKQEQAELGLDSTAEAGETDARRRARRPPGQDFDSYLVLDFEATCQRMEPKHGEFFGYPNEIIEFPIVLLQWRRKPRTNRRALSQNSSSSSCSSESSEGEDDDVPSIVSAEGDDSWELVIVDEFRQFVRPTWRPQLSQFCTELTGITQASVDEADTFAGVLNEVNFTFLCKHDLFEPGHAWTWVTDGPWDLRDFAAKQCQISGIKRPSWLSGPYVDLRTSATAYLARGQPVQDAESATAVQADSSDPPKARTVPSPSTRALGTPNIPTVLAALGAEPFQGREHSGIDDCRNIARILQELVKPERNWRVCANAKVHSKEKKWQWMQKGRVAWEHPFVP